MKNWGVVLLAVALLACLGIWVLGWIIGPAVNTLLSQQVQQGQPAAAMPASTSAPVAQVPAVQATLVPPTATVAATPVKMNVAPSTQQGSWTIDYFDGATDQMKGWKFDDLVKDWSATSDTDFPKYNFQAKDGLEWGMKESAYCQRFQKCDINTQARGYRVVTGDYTIPGIDSCIAPEGLGCGIILVNVGDVTAMWRESSVDYGWTVTGRYWNGNALPTAIRAMLSNRAYEMLNVGASIGPFTMPVNAGANCSSAFGCQRVRLTFAITSGNELLVKGTQVVSR